MPERVWSIAGIACSVSIGVVGLAIWLAFAVICVFVVSAAIVDLSQSGWQFGASRWLDVAVLVMFVKLLLIARHLRKLEDKIEHLRMTAFASASYFDFVYGNERFDKLQGIGPTTKHALLKLGRRLIGAGDFADDVLIASYAKRRGQKVTLADDLRAHLTRPLP